MMNTDIHLFETTYAYRNLQNWGYFRVKQLYTFRKYDRESAYSIKSDWLINFQKELFSFKELIKNFYPKKNSNYYDIMQHN